jgi:hypothetical protein
MAVCARGITTLPTCHTSSVFTHRNGLISSITQLFSCTKVIVSSGVLLVRVLLSVGASLSAQAVDFAATHFNYEEFEQNSRTSIVTVRVGLAFESDRDYRPLK